MFESSVFLIAEEHLVLTWVGLISLRLNACEFACVHVPVELSCTYFVARFE